MQLISGKSLGSLLPVSFNLKGKSGCTKTLLINVVKERDADLKNIHQNIRLRFPLNKVSLELERACLSDIQIFFYKLLIKFNNKNFRKCRIEATAKYF